MRMVEQQLGYITEGTNGFVEVKKWWGITQMTRYGLFTLTEADTEMLTHFAQKVTVDVSGMGSGSQAIPWALFILNVQIGFCAVLLCCLYKALKPIRSFLA